MSISLEDWCKVNKHIDLLNYLYNKEDRFISYSSHKKIKWQCKNKHVFEVDPCKFTNRHRSRKVGKFSCPVCTGQKVIVNYNDLATTVPNLIQEWDYNKNTILPTQVTKGSHKYVWWRCKLGHSWQARISARVWGNNCPYCSDISKTSLPEQLIYFYIKKYFSDALNMYSLLGVSFDIYIPSLKVAIEYDGSYWHSKKDTNYKFDFAKQNNITLYKITGVVKDAKLQNTFYFNDTNLNLTAVNNELVAILYLFLKQVFNIQETFIDYNSAYEFACAQKLQSKQDIISLPSNIEFEYSPLNSISFNYIRNDNQSKLWHCFNGHTFSRRLDVIKRGSITCPYCHNKEDFRFWLLAVTKQNVLILDMLTSELEEVESFTLLSQLNRGLNVKGIIIRDNILYFDTNYLCNYSIYLFRKSFYKFRNVGFKPCNINSLDNQVFVYRLNEIFKLTSFSEMHREFNNLIQKYNRKE